MQMNFGGVLENVVTREEYPLDKVRGILKGEVVAVLGYGVQGPGQALNMKDNEINVIVGQREGTSSYKKALKHGWEPGKTLFSLEEAAERGTIIQYLLSDAAQKEMWPVIKPHLKEGDALYFSHGFSIEYKDQTEVIPQENIDVILAAPKGSGTTVRTNFVDGSGINSSYAVFQDHTGKAKERAIALGMAIGSGYLFETTFKKEVLSDLTGERGVLMGAPYGAWKAHFNVLKDNHFSPEDAFKHTVEISTQTISSIIGDKGADGLINQLPQSLLPYFSQSYKVAETTTKPIFKDLYQRVKDGIETKIVIEANSQPDYRDKLTSELEAIANSELGKAGAEVRQKRPAVPVLITNKYDAIMAGLLVGLFHTQYELLRSKGHSPSEAFNETSEEATQSLYPLIDESGIDWMYANCSTTAQRGALDWNGVFSDALRPGIKSLYRDGNSNQLKTDYDIIETILFSEMWKVGKTVRSLRPENQKK